MYLNCVTVHRRSTYRRSKRRLNTVYFLSLLLRHLFLQKEQQKLIPKNKNPSLIGVVSVLEILISYYLNTIPILTLIGDKKLIG